MSTLLEGRRIIVAGAGTRRFTDPDAPVGNGRAIAIRAAREGAVGGVRRPGRGGGHRNGPLDH